VSHGSESLSPENLFLVIQPSLFLVRGRSCVGKKDPSQSNPETFLIWDVQSNPETFLIWDVHVPLEPKQNGILRAIGVLVKDT
jgi:hypothetical protein